ncbi:MAG TPA: type II toxin-antitoxin system HigB family toxin [Coleofasciculaceae cyanobacterium]
MQFFCLPKIILTLLDFELKREVLNRYRLIVNIIYEHQRIYIKYILTHAEYDKDKWKNDPYY